MSPERKHKIVGIGEVLWDVFPDHRLPGGAPANVVFQVAQMGAEAVLCSRVGADPLGEELLAYLSEQGINIEGVQRDPDHPTGTVTVELARRDHPVFTIHEDVAWDYMGMNEAWENLLEGTEAVCFGSLAQRSPRSRDAVAACLEVAQMALRVFDVNLRPPWYDDTVIKNSVDISDVVKLNREEVRPLAEMLGTDGRDAKLFAAEVLENYENVEVVCITCGGQGCLLVDRSEAVELPGDKVEVADTVGAGDAFTAALTVGIVSGWNLPTIGEFANRAAALVASKPGGMPVLREEFADLRRTLGTK